MKYEAKNYEALIGTEGFSENALRTHFALYLGYVNNTNTLIEKLGLLSKEGKAATPEFAEMKRRFGWEFNGMRLHEYYFGGMKKGGSAINADSKLAKKIALDFGSFEEWEKDFRSTAASRGIGWGILYYDQTSDKLLNVWVNEHDVGHLAGCKVILNIDVFEHAFMLDYGTKRADYIASFMKSVDWQVASKRFE
ncbi:superoxide dismutase [Candidatus Micrarchaeota archaeon]|nr:superoxide dismutase [Candidatus Micrarchaeota archaeon]